MTQENNTTHDEKAAFDKQAIDRIAHGLIPDFRRLQPCDWFYNNPWRRPYLVEWIIGRYFEFALSHLVGSSVLEIGSGLGHMTLEFSRHGYDVTGLELSPESIAHAAQLAENDPFNQSIGKVHYIQADFMDWEPTRQFDNVCFFGTLHHFAHLDLVLNKTKTLLNPGGMVIAVEPARDCFGVKEASLVLLVRTLLSGYDGWFEPIEIPNDAGQIQNKIDDIIWEYQNASEIKDKLQSPHDNASNSKEMLAGLRERFTEVDIEQGLSFFYRIGGGIRSNDEEKTK